MSEQTIHSTDGVADTTATSTADGAEQPGDDDLLALYLRGDQGAFEALYTRHKGAVYRFFLRQLPEDAANDAFQETWSKLISAAGSYQPEGKFSGYLFTIAYNVLHDWQRKQMRDSANQQLDAEAADELPTTETTETAAAQAQLVEKLHHEIRKLPIAQRAVWILKQESGLGLAEIALLTNSTLEGVKSRLRYANQKLKSGMQKYVRT